MTDRPLAEQPAHVVTLLEPEVAGQRVTFRWRVEPHTAMYHRESRTPDKEKSRGRTPRLS